MNTMMAEQARDQVWEAIRTVTDPELDESVAALGFIQSVTVNRIEDGQPETGRAEAGGLANAAVRITFRLPTYWCAANFAFMMAEDIRDRVDQLPWVRAVTVELADHFSADEINNGIAAGHSFSASFPTEASGNLTSLRRLFRLKAFQRRQYRLLKYLIGASHDSRALLAMTIEGLRDLVITDAEGSKLRADYLAILPEFSRASATEGVSASLAFILPNGSPLDPDHFDDHLRQLRRTTTNIEFNYALCSSLLKARNSNTSVTKPDPRPIE